MNNDLISRSALHKFVEEEFGDDVPYEWAWALTVVDHAPAVDAVEVVHGRWEKFEDDYNICATEFTCSNCKESFCSSELTDGEFVAMMRFCPKCGAKMDGE